MDDNGNPPTWLQYDMAMIYRYGYTLEPTSRDKIAQLTNFKDERLAWSRKMRLLLER